MHELEIHWLTLIIGAITIAGTLIIRKIELSRLRMRNKARMAAAEAKRLEELNRRKSQFFSEISHEFRIPLTLIKGPVENLIEESTDPHQKSTLHLIQENSTRMLQLINQLLDLYRIESGRYELHAGRGDFLGFINGVVMSYSSLAEEKKIELGINIDPEIESKAFTESFYYDPDILEKIIHNLLSNAFKFTPEKGRISCELNRSSAEDGGECLEIAIADTGIGIPENKLPQIFERFYQIESRETSVNQGSGIGLAYVSELISVHRGDIRVSSKKGEGSRFMLRLPMGKEHLSSDQLMPDRVHMADYKPPNMRIHFHTPILTGDREEDPDQNNTWVLVVDDHLQARHFVVECLGKTYRTMQAANAFEGMAIAGEFMPDLIVSDVIMPGIDGFQFCEQLKRSDKTSHIPVVLLTARTEEHDLIHGLETGADAYLTKPFSASELRTRVKNLIETRRTLRQKYSSNSIVVPGEISVSSRDAKLVEKMLRIVEKNIGVSGFSVDDLGKEAGMSQSQLYRKLTAVVNMTPNQFIRSVRMHHAKKLLQQGYGNISDVAFKVGYEDPAYFSTSFRKFFGKLPSELHSIL